MTIDNPRDQALKLRNQVLENLKRNASPQKATRVLAVAGAKGGIGRSTLAVNIACQLASNKMKTLLFDANYGLGSTDILMGAVPPKDITSVLQEGISLKETIFTLPNGLALVAAGAGNYAVANSNPVVLEGVLLEMENMVRQYDRVIIDTSSGIGERVFNTLGFADEVLLVVTPDPAAIMDAYATLKIIAQGKQNQPVHILVNKAIDERDAQSVFDQVAQLAKKYLAVNLDLYGWVPRDAAVLRAARKQIPLCICEPNAASSKAIRKISDKLCGIALGDKGSKIARFLQNLIMGSAGNSWGHARAV